MRTILCDLTHTGQGYGSEFIPYAIGCLDAYARSNAVLCKTVDELKEACQEKPDLVGFSHYLWNTRLSNECARQIKKRWPDVQIVFGGPCLTQDLHRRTQWLEQRPWINVYITQEGEQAWDDVYMSVLERCDFEPGTVLDSAPLKDINEIPSPYLSGALDRYLDDEHLVPLIEGTRGCPFTCTFCVQGAWKVPIRHYELDKLRDEVEHIAQRTKVKSLYMADANFGMYQHDEAIADMLTEMQAKYGYPEYIVVSTAKSQKERVIRIANRLGRTLPVAASVQSLDPAVLKAIERSNISTDELAAMPLALTDSAVSYSEIISALPEDTREKHIGSICRLMDMGYDQIRMHQLTLLPGTKLEANRAGIETRRRLLQRFFGKYDLFEPFRLYESEEIAYQHATFSADDFLYCRAFGLTVSLMFNEGIGKDLARFFSLLASNGKSGESAHDSASSATAAQNEPRNVKLYHEWDSTHRGSDLTPKGTPMGQYSDYLQYAHHQMMDVPQPECPITREYERFRKDAAGELHQDESALEQYMNDFAWSELFHGNLANNLLRNTQGRINFHHHEALNALMFRLARGFLADQAVDLNCLAELEEYCRLLKGPLSDMERVDRAVFHYDFETFKRVPGYTVTFAYEQWQKDLFGNLIQLFGTTDQGLGKLIARAPIKHTYRHVAVTEN